MAELKLIAPPGTRASYSQEGFNLAGRIVEKVTGLTYERAVASLLFEPLGLSNTTYSVNDVMTRRFAVGHNLGEGETLSIARQWKDTRGNNPGGGIASSVVDQLRWARFHLGDGRAESGARVLPAEVLHRMKEPTVKLRGTTLGDAIGLGWFLRDVDGVRTVGHGGSGNGQFAELLIVPERDFAVVAMSNAGPGGIPCNQAVVRWALETYLGVSDRDPEPLPYDEARAREVVGSYENDAMTFTVATDGAGLRLEVGIKPEIRAAADTELPADYDPFDFGLLPGDADEYIVTSGALKGQRGFWESTSPAGCSTGFRRPPSERYPASQGPGPQQCARVLGPANQRDGYPGTCPNPEALSAGSPRRSAHRRRARQHIGTRSPGLTDWFRHRRRYQEPRSPISGTPAATRR